MNITVWKTSKQLKVEVGDIIKYEETSRRSHSFYMICYARCSGYFVMSLTGEKSRMRFYGSIDKLLNSQSNIEKIYSKKEWEMRLEQI
ncbi:hypothetical protein CON39_11795 [Bacillus thuringiensis]|uniref:hypothetical protein n=1 Tax=Bacillus thuringiensis TaxID=1428 RepID=UPI000BEE191B|nr:hypothetical protein [Bacillus thuringiensis]PEF30348.1 hypothetical protein CON39_11795 [Bacillus thuringiensis]